MAHLFSAEKKKQNQAVPRNNFFINIIIVLLLIVPTEFIYAQWECSSRLNGFLKPVPGFKNLQWSSEITAGYGFYNEYNVNHYSLIGAAEYNLKEHSFFLSGGLKTWNRETELNEKSQKISHHRFGLKSAEYSFSKKKLTFSAGLREFLDPNFFLLNERAWGFFAHFHQNAWNFHFSAATVTKDFARNGTFCGIRFLYSNACRHPNTILGENWGETNFWAFSFSYEPGRKKQKIESSNSQDEFSDFSTIDKTPESIITLEKTGLIFYQEFGSYYHEIPYYPGYFANFNIKSLGKMKTQGIHQFSNHNNLFLYSFSYEKYLNNCFIPDLDINFHYFGKYSIDGNSFPALSFSNLFAGEVQRLDAPDFPFSLISLKTRILKSDISLKCQWVRQWENSNLEEWDIFLSKTVFQKIKIRSIYSYLNDIHGDNHLIRLEFRLNL